MQEAQILPPMSAKPAAPPPRAARHIAREILETLGLTLVIFLAIHFSIQPYRIVGPSMQPGLHTDELVLVNLLAYRFGDFTRAIVNYDAALRLDPSLERAWRDRAAVFALTSRYDRAAADLAQAERIRRAHPVVVVRHRVNRAGAIAQDALWRQSQRAHPIDRVLDHPANQLLLTSQSTVPWPAAAGG